MEDTTISTFQQQFPLSPKKFWKKFLGNLMGIAPIIFITVAFLIAISVVHALAPEFLWETVAIYILLIIIDYSIRIWYIKAYIRRYYYSTSDDFVTIKKGVFGPREIHVLYQKIQDVYVDQDILDRMLGLYDVHIASATVSSGMEAHIDGVEETTADGLKAFFLGKIGSGAATVPQAQATQMHETTDAPTQPIDQSKMISSDQYPIQSGWMGMQGVLALGHGVWISFLIALLAFRGNAFIQSTTVIWILIVVFVFVFLINIAYSLIWKNNFRFAFLPDYIQYSTQVLSRSEEHMPYKTIQDVMVNQGIIERMFGLATVMIQNATNQGARRGFQGMRIPGQSLESANKIAEVVRSIALTKNSSGTGL
jgi:putative membrane protein